MHAHRPRTYALALLALSSLGALVAGVFASSAVTKTVTPHEASPLALPAPTGALKVGTTTLHLVDRSRLDALAQPPAARELMVQLWYPAARAGIRIAPYMSAGRASTFEKLYSLPAGTFGSLPTHASESAPLAAGRHPLLLFSHGLGQIRTFSTALLEELASRGYVVAAIDHTYDAGVVEFPDGRLVDGIASPLPAPAERQQLLATRVGDVRFVLNELTRRATARSGFLAGHLDLRKVGALGHSFGGATAAAAMLADSRIVAGVDLDGKVWDEVVEKGLDRPFMLVIGDDLGGRLTSDQAQFFAGLRGARYALHLPGAGHFSFTDLPFFASTLPGLDQLYDIGTIDPDRAGRALRAYVVAFFDMALLGKRAPLLSGPSAAYPEVQFLDGESSGG